MCTGFPIISSAQRLKNINITSENPLSFRTKFDECLVLDQCKMKCSVIPCNNRINFRFPRDKKLKEKWLEAIRRPDFTPGLGHGICSDHFLPEEVITESLEGGYKLERVRLKKGVVPSIFPWNQGPNTANVQSYNNIESLPLFELKTDDNQGEVLMKDPLMVEAIDGGPIYFVIESEQNQEEVVVSEITAHEFESKSTTSEDTNENIVKNIFNDHLYHISSTTDNESKHLNALCRYSIDQFENDPKGMFYFTGLESYEKFKTIFLTLGRNVHQLTYHGDGCPQKEMSAENKLFLTLWKLRRNCSDYELSQHFCVSEIAMKVIFKKMVIHMANQWSKLDIWPTKKFMNTYMPEGCKINTSSKKEPNSAKKDVILANLKINVEKNIKIFKILWKRFDDNYIALNTQIMGVCIMLCNYKEIIKK